MNKRLFKSFTLIGLLFTMTALVFSCSKDDETEETAGSLNAALDTRFVGTWVRDASVSGVVDEGYTLVLTATGAASYSWYRTPKTSSLNPTRWESSGTWHYDAESNRIITDCMTSSRGSALILTVVSVTSSTLVVRQEGSSNSRTYTKK